MADVKETLEALDFTVTLANVIDDSQKDGIDLGDAVKLVPVFQKLPAAYGNISLVPAEIEDMDDEEFAALKAKIQELKFNKEYVENIAEKALLFILSASELLIAVREAKETA